MSRVEAYVTFSTSEKKGFSWPDGFGHVLDDEIAALRCECQWALASLDEECARRKADNVHAPVTSLVEKIEENATLIQQLRGLSPEQSNIFQKLNTFLEDLTPKMEMQSKKYANVDRELCWQISRWTNVYLTLLLIVSIGRRVLRTFALHRAMRVFSYLQQHQDSLTDRVRGVLTPKAKALGIEGFLKNDKGPLARANTTDLIDAGTTSYDGTARVSLTKQPGLQLQKARAMDPPREGGSSHIWQQSPQVPLETTLATHATGSYSQDRNNDLLQGGPGPKKRKHAHSEPLSRQDSPAEEGTVHTDLPPNAANESWKLHQQGTSEDAEEAPRDNKRSQNTGLPNLSDGPQRFHKGPEHLGQVTSAGTTATMADHQQPRISTSDDARLSGMSLDREAWYWAKDLAPNGKSSREVPSQATSVVTRESGQRDEVRGLGSTVHDLQNNPFPIHAVGTPQLHGFGTNETVLRQDRYTIVDDYNLNRRMINTQGPYARQEISQATAIPLFNDSINDQSSSRSFMSTANDIVDAHFHTDPSNNPYFSQIFEPHPSYFSQTIEIDGPYFPRSITPFSQKQGEGQFHRHGP